MKIIPLADAELPESARRLLGRLFFGACAIAGLTSAALLLALPTALPWWQRLTLAGANVVFALLCAGLLRPSARPGFPMNAASGTVGVLAMSVAGIVAAVLGEGLRSPPLAFCGLIVCVVGATSGQRLGATLGAFALLEAALLGWLEVSGLIRGVSAPTPLSLALAFQWLVVACGLVGGNLISRVLSHYLHAAAEREQRFRGLLRIAADWYWEQDRAFLFTKVTRTRADPAQRGADPDGLYSLLPWDADQLGLTDDQLDAHRADLEAHRPFSGLLTRQRDAAGHWRMISISGEPKFEAGGAFAGYWGVARDVTDEVLAQHAIAASETRYRELFTRSPSPLFLHRRGLIFDANEAAARLFGYPNAAALNGLSLVSLFPAGRTRERVVERSAELEALPIGEALPVADFQLRDLDGRPLHVQATGVRVDTVSGPAILSIFYDITARKAAEGALRRSEAMLSHLFANSPDCVSLTDLSSGRFAMVNPAFTRMTGYSADEAVGRTALELGLWHDPSARAELLACLERDGRVIDMPAEITARSGARVSTLVSAGRFVMDQRDYLVLNVRDVTGSERTRLQHAAILERASIGIAFTRGGRFVQANPYFERMFGWGSDALTGQPGTVVWPTDADHREIGELAGPLLSTGKPFEIERRMRRRDGSLFWCRLLAQVVDRTDPSHGGTIWIADDVTERRRLDAALAAARDAAEAASRAKSAFLANTSHEIRTPLNGLLGLARLAMREDLPAARRQRYLEQTVDSAQVLADIMSDILDFSKIEAGKLALDDTPFDLHGTLRAVHHAYDALAQGKGLTLLLSIGAPVPQTVRGDPLRVRQILSNFITNALKFTERGHVRIEAGCTAGGALRLAVSDSGPGVAPEIQSRLFMPFSQGDTSTTRRFGGTGLGLSICRELAQMMGGAVGVDSTPGHGSTFWAELPLPSSAPAPRPSSSEAADLGRLQGRRVLVAEDNAVNMMIVVATLEQWGVQVEQADDGHAAIKAVHAAARSDRPIDLVLMDVQMPVMGGHEAARELRRHYPNDALPIVALTAAALVSERDEALAAGMDGFLTKPIDATKLRRMVADLVRGRA